MKTDKTLFQQDLIKLENLLAEYKNIYPQNFGMMFRKYLEFFLILLSVCMILDGVYDATVISTVGCIISPMLILFLVIQWIESEKKETFNKTTLNLKVLMHEVNLAETKYSKYPDIELFLKYYKASVSAEQTRKRKIKTFFWTCFCALFVFYGVMIFLGYYSHPKSHLVAYDQILGKEDNKPVLSILPLKNDITDSIKLQSGRLDVFFHYYSHKYYKNGEYDKNSGSYVALSTQIPTITGNSDSVLFRLTITDETGKPIDRCPCFVFHYVSGESMRSNDFPEYAYSNDNKFLFLYTLKYLQTNQERLRYLVEAL